MEFKHIPVMLAECIEGLDIKPDGVYLDCTLGGGGHSSEILKKLTSGLLIGVDKDLEAIETASKRLAKISNRFKIIHDDFKNVNERLDEMGIGKIDGVLIDLGVSSYQLDNAERGFSYIANARLDMRMDREQTLSAYEVVNTYDEERLANVIYEYGEEKLSRKIAHRIINARNIEPIKTTEQLAKIVELAYPPDARWKYGNPCKRTFQAIRIEVNGELTGLYDLIIKLARRLKVDGRMCVLTFHSLEDRIVKNAFNYLETDCICDKRVPICTCDKVSEVKLINKKPLTASKAELIENKRAECAKLRIVKKI